MYKTLIRPFLFLLPAETAHDFTMLSAHLCRGPLKTMVRRLFHFEDPRLRQQVLGMDFANPVGLAAGLDKYAKGLHFWPLLGVGHVEVGGVTPEPQPGNPKPRVFRLKKDRAIINRFGFNNDGVEALARKLARRPTQVPVGVNITKNEWTSNEEALKDYLICLERLHEHVDFVVVNVSCPNSTDVDKLQEKEPLMQLLKGLKERRDALCPNKPLLVKIGPDVTDDQIEGIVEVVEHLGIDGIIATNTSMGRSGLSTPKEEVDEIGRGGLSGPPITDLSTEVIRRLARRTQGKIPIIGVGGIDSAETAYQKIRAGASLVQLYTGMVYEGPGLIKQINKGLIRQLERDGFMHIREAIGADVLK